MIITPVASLPTNSHGERQLETHHLDDNFAALETALTTGFSALFATGGTSVPGLVTLLGGSAVTPALRVQGRVGLTLDGVTAVSILDQTVPLGTLAAGKALVVMTAQPVTVTRTYTDVVTGEVLADVMNVRAGQLAVIGAGDAGVTLDAQGYPLPEATTLPVARLTRTAGGATLDSTVDTLPTLRALSGGGVSTADLNALSTALTALLTAGLNDLDARVDVLEARPTIDVEAVQDTVAAMLGTQGTYDDAAGTYTLPPGLSSEQVMDTVAAMIQAGQNITVSYNDAADTYTISAAGGTVTSVAGRSGAVVLSSGDISDFAEAAQDVVFGAVSDTSDLDVTYDDPGNAFSGLVKGLWNKAIPDPAGASAGQAIRLNVGKTAWEFYTPPVLPTGGTAGYVLAKNTNADGDFIWASLASIQQVNLSSAATNILSNNPATVQDATANAGISGQGVLVNQVGLTISGFTLSVGAGSRVDQYGAIAQLDASGTIVAVTRSTNLLTSTAAGNYTFTLGSTLTLVNGARYIFGLDAGNNATNARPTQLTTTSQSVSQGGLTLQGWVRTNSNTVGSASSTLDATWHHRITVFNTTQKKSTTGPGISAGATSARPTLDVGPGDMHFDTTLNKPIWRNAANTGWVDATGTAVT